MTQPALQPQCPTHVASTGLDALAAATSGPATHRGHDTWTVLQHHRHAAATFLADVRGPFVRALHRHPEPARAVQGRQVRAEELLNALVRGMINAPLTCEQIVSGSSRPVQRRERRTLEYPVHIAVTRMGLVPDELTVRTLTDAGVDAFALALAGSRIGRP